MRHVVECSNPYESPKAPAAVKPRKVTPAYSSRMQAVRGEMWQGAKLIFKVVVIVYCGFLAVLIAVALLSLVFSAAPGELARFWQRLATLEGLKVLGVLVFTVPAILVLYCAVPASLIMGVRAAIRWRPSPAPEETAEESSAASCQIEATTNEDFRTIPSGSQREA